MLIGAARYSGMAIYWRSTSAKSYYIVGGTRTASELIEDDNKFDTYNSIAKRITYASSNPTIKPSIFDGIPSIMVILSIFSKTPVNFITITSNDENKHNSNINAIS